MATWSQTEGAPQPLGAIWLPAEESYNFSLYSRHATGVTLLLYTARDLVNPLLRVQLSYLVHKSGRIWHCRLTADKVANACYYAYSVEGPSSAQGEVHFFDPDKVLLDPYARSLFFPPDFRRSASIGRGSNAGRAPLGAIPFSSSAFDWSGESNPRHTSDTIIYEMHVRGFTKRTNSGVSPDKRGTFMGVVEKIPYLKELGITALELMPVFQYTGRRQLLGIYAAEFFFTSSGLCNKFTNRGSGCRVQGDGERTPSSRNRSNSRRGLQPHHRSRH